MARAIIVENMATEQLISRATKTVIKGKPTLLDNATTLERRVTGKLVSGIKRNKSNMKWKTFLWVSFYVEKSPNVSTRKILKNGW